MSQFDQLPELSLPPMLPMKSSQDSVIDANLASAFYHRLTEWITNFDKSLDEEHEVGVRLVSFGQTIIFHLTDMSYWNPSLIRFDGVTEGGGEVELIQHVTQISILLMKLPRRDPTVPKQPIGFS